MDGTQGQETRRVVFGGAESTGKSTLSDNLAAEYGTVSVPAIGRVILEEKQGKLNADDYVDIAVQHRAAEDAAMAGLAVRRYQCADHAAAGHPVLPGRRSAAGRPAALRRRLPGAT